MIKSILSIKLSDKNKRRYSILEEVGPCGGRVNSIFKILTELVSLECLSPWPGTEAQIREIRFSLFSGLDSVIVFNKMRKKKKTT